MTEAQEIARWEMNMLGFNVSFLWFILRQYFKTESIWNEGVIA
jgi:hypothetical protein